MFELVRLHDVVHIQPHEFAKPLLKAISDALCEKYPNKVVPDLGLCITLYDILHVGESQLYPGSGAHHTAVEFRLIVFRPYIGEIMTGTVVASDTTGVRVSLGFFDEIHVPARLLQKPSSFSQEEGVWVWNVTEDNDLFLDLENPLRFRVEEVRYREPTNSASGTVLTGDGNGAKPPRVQPGAPSNGNGGGAGTGGGPGSRGPPSTGTSAKVEAMKEAPPAAAAMRIIASIDRAGLGLTTWWPPHDDDEGEENADENADENESALTSS